VAPAVKLKGDEYRGTNLWNLISIIGLANGGGALKFPVDEGDLVSSSATCASARVATCWVQCGFLGQGSEDAISSATVRVGTRHEDNANDYRRKCYQISNNVKFSYSVR
jgi:hypothetical protein